MPIRESQGECTERSNSTLGSNDDNKIYGIRQDFFQDY